MSGALSLAEAFSTAGTTRRSGPRGSPAAPTWSAGWSSEPRTSAGAARTTHSESGSDAESTVRKHSGVRRRERAQPRRRAAWASDGRRSRAAARSPQPPSMPERGHGGELERRIERGLDRARVSGGCTGAPLAEAPSASNAPPARAGRQVGLPRERGSTRRARRDACRLPSPCTASAAV